MKARRPHVALAVSALLVASCGGSTGDVPVPTGAGDGGTPGPTGVSSRGIALPREVSAIASTAATTAPRSLVAGSVASRGTSLSTFAADSDYAQAGVTRYIYEKGLDQFGILDRFFRAVGQTRHDDPAVVGKGPYLANVSWTELQSGLQVKRLVQWQVDSRVVVENGLPVNKVQVWMPWEPVPGEVTWFRVQVNILEAPRMNPDGESYADYGKWSLVIAMEPGGRSYLVASADRDAAGMATIRIHQGAPGPGSGAPAYDMRGILRRSGAAGAGRVIYPDEECTGLGALQTCVPRVNEVAYVYDASTMTLRNGNDPPVSKDRLNVLNHVSEYGVFDATTGARVRPRSGFRVLYRDAQDVQQFGGYQAWKGEHHIWTPDPLGRGIPEGTAVTRLDLAPGGPTPSYTVSRRYAGILSRVDRVPATVGELEGLSPGIYMEEAFRLLQDGSGGWCTKEWAPPPLPGAVVDPARSSCSTADASPITDDDLAARLMPEPNGILATATYEDPVLHEERTAVWVQAGAWGPRGFYRATAASDSQPGAVMSLPHEQLSLPDARIEEFRVFFQHRYFLAWTGAGWVRKEVSAFDQATWFPTFATADHDVPYALEPGRAYALRDQGATYVVTRTDTGHDVWVEKSLVVNPANVQSMLLTRTTFWMHHSNPGGQASEYRFETDEASPDFMKLLYVTIGFGEPSSAAVGAPVRSSRMTLDTYLDGQPTESRFVWEYPQENQGGSAQQFLKDAGGFVILDEPIRFAPLQLENGSGDVHPFYAEFDGASLMGIPNSYDGLEALDFTPTREMALEAVAIPSGTEVTGLVDRTRRFVFKQIQISEYLCLAEADPLDLSAAEAISLDSVPGYVAPDPPMVTMDPKAKLLFSEGKPVE
jgi:hypothetical protein